MAKRRRGWGSGSVFRRGRVWWVAFRDATGRQIRESAHTEVKTEAYQYLQRRQGQFGKITHAELTLADLIPLIRRDYQQHHRDLQRFDAVLNRFSLDFILTLRVPDVTYQALGQYVTRRLAASPQPANGTINRELAAIRRMLALAYRNNLTTTPPPPVPRLSEAPARQGFLRHEDMTNVLAYVTGSLHSLFVAAYMTGWRLRSELLTRQWKHVDLGPRGYLRLEPGESKNRAGRMYPLVGQLRVALETQWANRGQSCWVFYNETGGPLTKHRVQQAWHQAQTAAGVGPYLIHDLRRTAARNLELAGVPRTVAMALIGHKTEAMYRRYAITDDARVREGAEALGKLIAL